MGGDVPCPRTRHERPSLMEMGEDEVVMGEMSKAELSTTSPEALKVDDQETLVAI